MLLEIGTRIKKLSCQTKQKAVYIFKRCDFLEVCCVVQPSQWLLCTAGHQNLQSLWNLTKICRLVKFDQHFAKHLQLLLNCFPAFCFVSKTRMSWNLLLKSKDVGSAADSVFRISDCFLPDLCSFFCPPPWPEAKEKSFAEQMNFLWPSARGVGI